MLNVANDFILNTRSVSDIFVLDADYSVSIVLLCLMMIAWDSEIIQVWDYIIKDGLADQS